MSSGYGKRKPHAPEGQKSNRDWLEGNLKFMPLSANETEPGDLSPNFVSIQIPFWNNPTDFSICALQVCGVHDVISEGIRLVRPGGLYVLIGMVHPDSKLDLTGEQIIRKCITIKGEIRIL